MNMLLFYKTFCITGLTTLQSQLRPSNRSCLLIFHLHCFLICYLSGSPRRPTWLFLLSQSFLVYLQYNTHREEEMFRIQAPLHGKWFCLSAASATGVNISHKCLFIKAVQVQQLLVCGPRRHLLHILCHFLKLFLQVIEETSESLFVFLSSNP